MSDALHAPGGAYESLVSRFEAEEEHLREQLSRFGLLDAPQSRHATGFMLSDLFEFCMSFIDDVAPPSIPTDAQMRAVEKALARAARELSPLTALPPSTFSFPSPEIDGSLSVDALASLLRGASNQALHLRKHMRSARGRSNPAHRLFRARWELEAVGRTREPLDSIGVLLFNIAFGTTVDEASYKRMRERDRKSLKVPVRPPTPELEISR